MTALAGAWFTTGGPALAHCSRMLTAQAAYAPGEPRTWDDGAVALGERLVRLTPEDRFQSGPIALGGGGAMVADARIDNREDIERVLGLASGPAAQSSDPMLLAQAWDRWGEGLLDRVVGDFAFAVWEPRRRRLTLARDAFGWRPLHYHLSASLFAFASMPMGLHALAEVPVALDEGRLAEFLALNDETGPASFFTGVQRVEPGRLVWLERGTLSSRRWYAPAFRPHRFKDPDDYAEGLRANLDLAVKARLRGAGPTVGSHLSSGWDSAAVTVTAARLMAAAGGRVAAFTAAPREDYDLPPPPHRHGDESGVAAKVAADHGNIDHVLVRSRGRSPLEGLDLASRLLGRPVLNACNQVWVDEICRRARCRGVRVVLTGEFGNEGLTDSGKDWLTDLAAAGRWLRWLQQASLALASGEMSLGGVIGVSFGGDPDGAFWRWVRRRHGQWSGRPGAYSPLPRGVWEQVRRADPEADAFQRRLAAATCMDPGPVHHASLAAFGIDHRAPLMDRRLVEFCLNTPEEQVFRRGRPRALARRALADRLPPAVLDQRTTGYQGIDWHEGLAAARSEASAEAARLTDLPVAARLLDLERLQGLLAEWPDGGWNEGRVFTEYRLALLRGLSAGRFMRTALGANV